MIEERMFQKRTTSENKRITFNRNIEAQVDLEKLTDVNNYVKINEPGSRHLAYANCTCGKKFSILKSTYVIDPDGAVWPAVYHDDCGFNEWIKFDEWVLKVEMLTITKEFCPYCRDDLANNDHDLEACKREVILYRKEHGAIIDV